MRVVAEKKSLNMFATRFHTLVTGETLCDSINAKMGEESGVTVTCTSLKTRKPFYVSLHVKMVGEADEIKKDAICYIIRKFGSIALFRRYWIKKSDPSSSSLFA